MVKGLFVWWMALTRAVVEWSFVVMDSGRLWDEDDVRVACRQLGLPTEGYNHVRLFYILKVINLMFPIYAVVYAVSGFGSGNRHTHLSNVHCNGDELRLQECRMSYELGHNCTYYKRCWSTVHAYRYAL